MLDHSFLLSVLHYDPDTGVFTWRVALSRRTRVGEVAGTRMREGYTAIAVCKKKYPAGRLAFFYMTGEWPNEEIDHRNGDRSDDRWANLREASRAENNRNRGIQRTNRSGFKGVYAVGKKWAASVRTNGRANYLGLYETPEAASLAYQTEAEKLHGAFARII